ncbi:MAG: hypothetical protein F4X69_15890 [Gemmatimonadetes bacterium]|nr:hypothetical protein [Gemmatimonadota bacterium]
MAKLEPIRGRGGISSRRKDIDVSNEWVVNAINKLTDEVGEFRGQLDNLATKEDMRSVQGEIATSILEHLKWSKGRIATVAAMISGFLIATATITSVIIRSIFPSAP